MKEGGKAIRPWLCAVRPADPAVRRAYFRIGDRQDWSYLLPRRLGPGRYVLDAVAIDKAGNREALARGRNRVVFFVR